MFLAFDVNNKQNANNRLRSRRRRPTATNAHAHRTSGTSAIGPSACSAAWHFLVAIKHRSFSQVRDRANLSSSKICASNICVRRCPWPTTAARSMVCATDRYWISFLDVCRCSVCHGDVQSTDRRTKRARRINAVRHFVRWTGTIFV
jgi:hypothetical protein